MSQIDTEYECEALIGHIDELQEEAFLAGYINAALWTSDDELSAVRDVMRKA